MSETRARGREGEGKKRGKEERGRESKLVRELQSARHARALSPLGPGRPPARNSFLACLPVCLPRRPSELTISALSYSLGFASAAAGAASFAFASGAAPPVMSVSCPSVTGAATAASACPAAGVAMMSDHSPLLGTTRASRVFLLRARYFCTHTEKRKSECVQSAVRVRALDGPKREEDCSCPRRTDSGVSAPPKRSGA